MHGKVGVQRGVQEGLVQAAVSRPTAQEPERQGQGDHEDAAEEVRRAGERRSRATGRRDVSFFFVKKEMVCFEFIHYILCFANM